MIKRFREILHSKMGLDVSILFLSLALFFGNFSKGTVLGYLLMGIGVIGLIVWLISYVRSMKD